MDWITRLSLRMGWYDARRQGYTVEEEEEEEEEEDFEEEEEDYDLQRFLRKHNACTCADCMERLKTAKTEVLSELAAVAFLSSLLASKLAITCFMCWSKAPPLLVNVEPHTTFGDLAKIALKFEVDSEVKPPTFASASSFELILPAFDKWTFVVPGQSLLASHFRHLAGEKIIALWQKLFSASRPYETWHAVLCEYAVKGGGSSLFNLAAAVAAAGGWAGPSFPSSVQLVLTLAKNAAAAEVKEAVAAAAREAEARRTAEAAQQAQIERENAEKQAQIEREKAARLAKIERERAAKQAQIEREKAAREAKEYAEAAVREAAAKLEKTLKPALEREAEEKEMKARLRAEMLEREAKAQKDALEKEMREWESERLRLKERKKERRAEARAKYEASQAEMAREAEAARVRKELKKVEEAEKLRLWKEEEEKVKKTQSAPRRKQRR
jgi:hypothetical protein